MNKEQGISNEEVNGSPPFGVQVPCSEFLVPCSLFNNTFLNFYPGNFNRYGENSPMKDMFNVYGLLGQVYLENGETEKAIGSFKKAIELNPKDLRAIEALKN